MALQAVLRKEGVRQEVQEVVRQEVVVDLGAQEGVQVEGLQRPVVATVSTDFGDATHVILFDWAVEPQEAFLGSLAIVRR